MSLITRRFRRYSLFLLSHRQNEGLVDRVVFREALAALHPGHHSPGGVVEVEAGPDSEGVVVEGLHEVRQQGPLGPHYVPHGQLVRAGHGAEPLPRQHSVPGLQGVYVRDGDRP